MRCLSDSPSRLFPFFENEFWQVGKDSESEDETDGQNLAHGRVMTGSDDAVFARDNVHGDGDEEIGGECL